MRPRRGYFSEEEETESEVTEATRVSELPAPRVGAPTPQRAPRSPRAPRGMACVVWDRECAGHIIVRAVEVAPTVIVTDALVCALRASRNVAALGALSRSERVAKVVDLSRVPSTARHARQMVVLHTDGSVLAALAADGSPASRVEVVDGSPGVGEIALARGPEDRRRKMRLRIEGAVPRLSVRCAVLRRPAPVRATPLATELLRKNSSYRSGWIAIERRCAVLLEDDAEPEVPLVGAWVSGLCAKTPRDACADHRVVAACRAYLARGGRGFEPDALLLALFYRHDGKTDLAFVEATAVYESPADRPTDATLVDFVADIDDRDETTPGDGSFAFRAVLAARLLPRADHHDPPRLETPRDRPAPHNKPDRPALESPKPNDDSNVASLQAQLHDLRRRLDDLEARAKPPTKEMATETTDTLLVERRPPTTEMRKEMATETTDTLLVERQPTTDGLQRQSPTTDTHLLRNRQPPTNDTHLLRNRQPTTDGLQRQSPTNDTHLVERQPTTDAHLLRNRQPPTNDTHLVERQPTTDAHLLRNRQLPTNDTLLVERQPSPPRDASTETTDTLLRVAGTSVDDVARDTPPDTPREQTRYPPVPPESRNSPLDDEPIDALQLPDADPPTFNSIDMAETIDFPKIVCPCDVDDLLGAHDDDDASSAIIISDDAPDDFAAQHHVLLDPCLVGD
ncbi:hypothetical protein CTAYLR_007230 [Chrysophaeum taylorii]|uniref:Uncharacterized protein n=1 Tax=Chrysophaeum taylorii TaxID=2483200 RepID=A0AAD7UAR2_9STRA|nr:hypothetical protein CTAYLR_007230 [Chrysophaeum taylorii]